MRVITTIKGWLPLLLIATLLSCDETFELEILEDPNALNPGQADIDLFINNIQISLGEFYESSTTDNFDGVNEINMEVVRMVAMIGGPSYLNAYDPGSFNEVWEDGYEDILADIRTMTPLAEEAGLHTHVAIGQIIEAYVMMTLVDMFGEVPYTEAAQGSENFNPAPDDGASIYAAAEALLDQAIANLALEETALPTTDIFYGGNEENWVRLANTLKLKLYIQTRLVDNSVGSKIQALIDEGNLIEDASQDFAFRWSQTVANPNSRHPLYDETFGTGSSPTIYIGNWYMNLLLNGQDEAVDPRIRYYFYRQELNYDEANTQTKECVNEDRPTHYAPDDVFCILGTSGYWGRDHADADGIPPDGPFRTVFGPYPVGGPFDDNTGSVVFSDINAGLAGAGISPIMMSFFVDFMLAEAGLTLGVGDARTSLENGIRKSIATVVAFGAPIADEEFVPTDEEVQTYIDAVLADYDAADENGKLGVIVRQYFAALWGNGLEANNTYRRTGQPADIQPTLLDNPGPFPRTFQYPARAADFNQSITQKPVNDPVPVFWDTNPDGFVR